MQTAVMTETSILDSLSDQFARNLIGGRGQFAAAPYEFEIRSPADSRILAVVPLSSRFDVTAAVVAARAAAQGEWADQTQRQLHLRRLLDRLTDSAVEVAVVQAAETGLQVEDSLAAVGRTVRELVALTVARAARPDAAGVSGHILSWGLPFTEIVTSVWRPLLRGEAVVVKPSLRAPLSAALFGHLATECGLPAGVVNIVQGTGVDVGAELIGRRDLAAVHVRGGERTIAAAQRARTGVPLHVLRAGGNVVVVGPDPVDLDRLGEHVSALVRMNSAGGPFGLPLLAVHARHAGPVIDAVVGRLSKLGAAPLPSEPLRARARDAIRVLEGAGAVSLLGGGPIPDDIPHRMGWRLPPAVLSLGMPDSRAAAAAGALVPLGPVLGIVTYDDPSGLSAMLAAPRHADGIAWTWGLDPDAVPDLPQQPVLCDDRHGDPAETLRIPPSWMGAHDDLAG